MPPAPARPRSPPCRRGNCRPGDNRASAYSRDAGSRSRAAAPPARWSRRRPLRPSGRRVRRSRSSGSLDRGEFLGKLTHQAEHADWAPPDRARRSTRRASRRPVRSRSARSQIGRLISAAAFWVPTRHGVHCPQDSSSKNRMRLRAAAFRSSCSESTTTAAEPMKQPCFSSVPKSSGRSPMEAGRIPPEAPPGR